MTNYNRSRPKTSAQRKPKVVSKPASLKSKQFGQNFFHNFRRAFELVEKSGINSQDTVVEIGPGEGAFTRYLIQKAGKVIAVELDNILFKKLQIKFEGTENLTLVNDDFLKIILPKSDYKVFSNLPFNISAEALRKLLYATNPPTEAYLIVQSEVAEKLTGKNENSQAAMLYQPWFEFKVMQQLSKMDFHPIPAVDCVFLKITKREQPLLDKKARPSYEDFVKFGYSRWRTNLRQNFKKVFTSTQWERLADDWGFKHKALPSELNVEQWVALFDFYASITPSN